MTASPWACFYDPFTPLSGPLWHIAAIDAQFVGYWFIRQLQSHEVETPYPHLQWVRMSGNNGIGQLIKPCVTVHTRRALTGGFCVINPALGDLGGLTIWARGAIWPAPLANRLIAPGIIDQICDIALQARTPAMGWERGGDELTPSSSPRPWNPT